jgi:chromosomal replication initiator protein
MIACWIMRNFTSMSLPQIGAKLGGRDHSTIAHSVERVEKMRASDPSYRALVDNIVATVMQTMKGDAA